MTSPITGGAGATVGATPTTAPKQTLDADVFMQLLVTQLKNQDPSSPMDTSAMIGQTTQLAMMQSLTALGKTTDESFGLNMRTSAAAYIGKQVGWSDADGTAKSGVVSSVSFSGSVPTVTVGTSQIPLDQLTGVQAPSA